MTLMECLKLGGWSIGCRGLPLEAHVGKGRRNRGCVIVGGLAWNTRILNGLITVGLSLGANLGGGGLWLILGCWLGARLSGLRLGLRLHRASLGLGYWFRGHSPSP